MAIQVYKTQIRTVVWPRLAAWPDAPESRTCRAFSSILTFPSP